jgi:Flp pilus assembly protein TadG
MTKFLRAFLGSLAAFRESQNGQVAIIFGLTLIPVVGMTGAAIDYTRASSVRTAMQAALDATALAISRDAASLNATALNEKANAYFHAAFNRPEATNVQVGATYSSVGGHSVTVSASSTIKTTFMGILGFDEITVGSTAKSAWGNIRLRVALVLDTTGSMASAGKMTALKTATKDLLDQLKAAANTSEDVYVSIIPFSKNVNVGSFNHAANWIDWTDWEAEPDVLNPAKGGSKPSNWYSLQANSACPFTSSNHGFRCVSAAQGSTNVSNIPSSGNFNGLICPGRDSGNEKPHKIGIIYNGCYNTWTKCVGSNCACTTTNTSICTCTGSDSSKTCQTKSSYKEHTWRPSKNETYTPALALNAAGDPYATPAHSTWTGCVTDRGTSAGPSGDYDRKSTPPGGDNASKFPAEQNYYCSPEIVGLNNNWSAMKTMVDNMYPEGATNQPIGLVWGWHSLLGAGPLTAPAKDPAYTYRQAIVLMSDGLNTLNRWNGNGSTTNTAVDLRMHESSTVGTCANIKATGITIYTIHVNTDGDPTSTLLRDCASSLDKFYIVTSASGIGAVFEAIGKNLTKLRLAL